MTDPSPICRARLCLLAMFVLPVALTACRSDGGPVSNSTPPVTPPSASAPEPQPVPPPAPVSYQLEGTVAYGSPVVGQIVEALDSTGKVCATATTTADGTYSMDTTGCAPGSAGLSLRGYLTPDGASLLSVAVPPPGMSIIDGVVNIDPLTTLLAYDVAGMVSSDAPATTSAQVLSLLPRTTAAHIQQATSNILSASLLSDLESNYGVTTTGFSITSTPFSANGQGLDAFFDAYRLTAPSAGSVQIASVASGLTVNVALPSGAGSPSIVTSSVSYTIGGNVTGLSGVTLTLTLNGTSPLVISGNGAFTFPATVSTTYVVGVSSQPAGQTCTVSNGSGAGITANVVNIGVTCSTNSFAITGSVTGLGGGKQVVLSNNNADALVVSGNGTFSFSTPVAYQGSYSVTVTTQPVGQTCTVSHASGAAVTADVLDVSVQCSTVTYGVGGTVSGLAGGSVVTLLNNGGDALSVAANGSFTFATSVTAGSSYAVTVGTQPSAQTCSVTNGTGANVAAAVTGVQVTCASRVAYIYVPNYGSNNVLGYKFDFATGASTSIPGSPFASGANDRWVTTNPAGTFAYAANQNDNTVSAYTINRATGALTQVSGSPFATGTTPVAMAVHPAGTFLYVTNSNGGTVSAYAIDQTTGGLTPVAGSPFAANALPTKIAIHPAGTFAYVTNVNSSTVTAFSIDASTGALTEIAGSPFSVGGGNQPQGIAVNPTGTAVYVTNWQANVAALSIDGATGALTPIAGSPFTADATGWGWQSVAINPAGKFAYVGAGNGTPLLVFSIDPTTGALTQITSATYGAAGWNYAVFDSTGSKIIISNAWNLTIGVADVNAATGHLTDQAGSPFGVGARPFDIAVVEP